PQTAASGIVDRRAIASASTAIGHGPEDPRPEPVRTSLRAPCPRPTLHCRKHAPRPKLQPVGEAVAERRVGSQRPSKHPKATLSSNLRPPSRRFAPPFGPSTSFCFRAASFRQQNNRPTSPTKRRVFCTSVCLRHSGDSRLPTPQRSKD